MKNVFVSLAAFVNRRALSVLVSCLALTAVLLAGLGRLQLQMGNDSFVQPTSAVYRETRTLQNYFGGDSFFILLKGKKNALISKASIAAIHRLSKQVQREPGLGDVTSFVSVCSAFWPNAANGSQIRLVGDASVKGAIAASLTRAQRRQVETLLLSRLTEQQQAQLQRYVLHLLTPQQIIRLLHIFSTTNTRRERPQQVLDKVLTDQQKKSLLETTINVLTLRQQSELQTRFIRFFPAFDAINEQLLRKLIFADNGHVSKPLRLLLPQNGKYALLIVRTSGPVDLSANVRLNERLVKIIHTSHFDSRITATIAGPSAVLGRLVPLMIRTIARVMFLSLVVMLLILHFVFHVRRRLLTIGFVLIGTVCTFGLMGWCHMPITLATIAALPIIIGLGTDFGVQFQTRYEEGYCRHRSATEAVNQALGHMGPTIGLAVFVMTLSFLTLLFSKAPMMQQFGVTLALGVLICYTLALLPLPALLRLLDRDHPIAEHPADQSLICKLPAWLARQAVTRRRPLFIVALLLAAAGFSAERLIPLETDFQKLVPQHFEALDATHQLQQVAGSSLYLTYLIQTDDVRRSSVLRSIEQFSRRQQQKHHEIEAVLALPQLINQTQSSAGAAERLTSHALAQIPQSLRRPLIGGHNKYSIVQFRVNQNLPSIHLLRLMRQITEDSRKLSGLKIKPAGAEALLLIGMKNISAYHYLMVVSGLMVILAGLLLIYRKMKEALLPLVPILFVLGYSPGTLYLMGVAYNPITITLNVLILGIGTEFTLLILERYREELLHGKLKEDALQSALNHVGGALLVSALTVIGGFSTLTVSGFPILQSFGIITMLDTAYALISALIILPALIALLDWRTHA
ncbi:MAG: MMPL family transporter [Sporolactobacillus sp.]